MTSMTAGTLNAEPAAVKIRDDIHGKGHLRLPDKHRLDIMLGSPLF